MSATAQGAVTSREQPASWQITLCRIAVFAVLALRHPDVLLNAQLTWEDGRIFLTEALTRPWYSTWFSPFIGYFIVLPKVVASLFTPLTLLYAPLVFNAFSLCVMTFALTLPLGPSFIQIAPWRDRALWVAGCVLLPWHTETFGNITNVHWYVYFALTLFSIADLSHPRTLTRYLLPPALLVAVFTTPNAIAVAPVLAWQAWRRRAARSYQLYVRLFAMVVIALMVFLTLLSDVRTAVQGSRDLAGSGALLVKGLGYKVVIASLAGGLAARLLQHTALYIAAFGGFAGLVAYVLRTAHAEDSVNMGRTKALAVVAAYYAVASVLMCAFLRPQYVVHFVQQGNYWGADRYFLIPSFYLFLLIVLALDQIRRVQWWPRVRVAAAVLYAAVIIMNFRYPAIPDYRWRAQLQAYYQRLLAPPSNAPASSFPIVTFPGDPWTLHAPLFTPSAEQRRRLRGLIEKLQRRDPGRR